MKAVVVYESFWGNTAAIARTIAEGIGSGVRALTTAEATGEAIAGADLIVAGAPVVAFNLSTEKIRENMAKDPGKAPVPPDLTGPALRTWLAALPAGRGRAAAFETRLKWSPGGSTSAIIKGLKRAGYRPVGKAHRFVVKGSYGPLRDGELERAREWGAELAKAIADTERSE